MNVEGFVLAGGQSSRMGTDKALLQFAGEPLVLRALRILGQAELKASIAGARSSLQVFAPVIPDAERGRGPLSGICAALASTASEFAAFLPVDMPLVPPHLLLLLLREAQASQSAVTLPVVNGFTQTFPVVLHCHTLPFMRQALAAGQLGCLAAFHAAAARLRKPVSTIPIEQALSDGRLSPNHVPLEHWLMNLNKPEDLACALQFASEPEAPAPANL